MNMNIDNFTQPLVQWFLLNRRELPWRKDKNPYHVWVSEIMLQQTRIETVKSYYTRFMDAFPDVETLSLTEEEQLLKYWEGLGYYSRAKNLRKAALMIMRDYHGNFPDNFQDLCKLPGIGEYTAGAIASICFDEKVTAIDGNVLRVTARFTGSNKNILLPETKDDIQKKLIPIMPEHPGLLNEAIMELGETICLPGGIPNCEHCPLNGNCSAFHHQTTDKIPVRIKPVKRRQVHKTVFLIISDNHRIALKKRPDSGLLSGMYQFPDIDCKLTQEEILSETALWQLSISNISFLKRAKHVFTHIDWLMDCYLVKTMGENELFIWADIRELEEKYPVPTAYRKLIPTTDI